MLKKIIDNLRTLFIALLIAVIIRSLLFQPFYIPSSSMEPTLLVGDRIFVSKYTYGYTKHSFPFSPPIFKNRIFNSKPNYGDLIVFKTPTDNRTDFIKRLIGLPGDTVQFVDGNLIINKKKNMKNPTMINGNIRCAGKDIEVGEATLRFKKSNYKEAITDCDVTKTIEKVTEFKVFLDKDYTRKACES